MSGLICIQTVDILVVFLKVIFWKKFILKKSSNGQKSMQKLPLQFLHAVLFSFLNVFLSSADMILKKKSVCLFAS